MGRFLDQAGLVPDRIVTSTAVRARTTAELVAEAAGWSTPLVETRRLYATTVEGALEVVREQAGDTADGPSPQTLLLVGHEPTWSSLASALVGGGRLAVVTATAVVIDLAIEDWSSIARGRGELRMLLPPRLLSSKLVKSGA